MRDKELSFWTCRGIQTAGLFVATIDDEVVGTVSYIRQVGWLFIDKVVYTTHHLTQTSYFYDQSRPHV